MLSFLQELIGNECLTDMHICAKLRYMNISPTTGPLKTNIITNDGGKVIGKIYSAKPRGIRLVSYISSPFANELGGANNSKSFKTRRQAIAMAKVIFTTQ